MTYDEVEELVDEQEGVATVWMAGLRTAQNAGKLGVHVRKAISDELNRRGLGYYPKPLPEYQQYQVRVYRLGSRIANIIDAVLDIDEESNETIRSAAGGDAGEVLKQVRALVCR
jgi:hypothetical protein